MGEMLLEKGILSQNQLKKAIECQEATRRRFGEVVVSLGFVEESEITACLAEQYDLPLADLNAVKSDSQVLALVTPTFALAKLFLPTRMTETELHGVIADPIDIDATDHVTRAVGKKLRLSLAPPTALFEKIAKVYAIPAKPRETLVNAPAPAKRKRPIKIDTQADRSQLLDALSDIAPQKAKVAA